MKHLATRITRHPKLIERGRLWGESLACVYVALETHFLAFQVILAIWLVIDIAAFVADVFGREA